MQSPISLRNPSQRAKTTSQVSTVGLPRSANTVSSVLRAKNSSSLNTLNTLKSRRKLAHQKSKLDLIDDTTLTSLPFPPPPPRAKLNRSNSTIGDFPSSSNFLLEPPLIPVRTSNSAFESLDCSTFLSSTFTVTEDPDECSDETDDPIVLVEDYLSDAVAERENTRRLMRKESLATFKQKYYSSRLPDLSCTDFHLVKRSLSDQEAANAGHLAEDLEAIFGKLPGTDKLKHCVFCDKPLYEISSIISNSDIDPQPKGKPAPRETYTEFVCWDCIHIYEQFVSELHEMETLLVSNTKPPPSEDIVEIFKSLRDSCGASAEMRPPKKQSRRAFSNDLLGRLHYLSSVSQRPAEASWLESLAAKLRWNRNIECISRTYPMGQASGR